MFRIIEKVKADLIHYEIIKINSFAIKKSTTFPTRATIFFV